jgi:hypothetical protein
MNRLIQVFRETLSRADRPSRLGSGDSDIRPTDDLDPWNSYVKVLEEARARRGRLFPRL